MITAFQAVFEEIASVIITAGSPDRDPLSGHILFDFIDNKDRAGEKSDFGKIIQGQGIGLEYVLEEWHVDNK